LSESEVSVKKGKNTTSLQKITLIISRTGRTVLYSTYIREEYSFNVRVVINYVSM